MSMNSVCFQWRFSYWAAHAGRPDPIVIRVWTWRKAPGISSPKLAISDVRPGVSCWRVGLYRSRTYIISDVIPSSTVHSLWFSNTRKWTLAASTKTQTQWIIDDDRYITPTTKNMIITTTSSLRFLCTVQGTRTESHPLPWSKTL